MKLRALLTKGEEIRFISHLDYAALIERAIRRAKLPVAYSEGFNPHMKFSFASALAVGVTSEAEVMDVELSRPVAQPEAWDRLAAALPPGVRLGRLVPYEGKAKSLMAAVDRAEYRVRVPYAGAEEAARQHALRESFDVAVSRAVARLSVLAEYLLPFVRLGGRAIALKGLHSEEEAKEAGRAVQLLGSAAIEAIPVRLPGLSDKRAVLVMKKERLTPKEYPRKAGKPAKEPLL